MDADAEASATADLGRELRDELRPAIESAFHVARSLARNTKSSVEVPAALRPFLTFAKLPPRALDIVREAIDADEAFRKHVVSLTEEHEVGELGWLWLDRPDGWVQRLADAEAEAIDRRRSADAELRAKALERQVQRLELDHQNAKEALAAVEEARDQLDRSLAQARTELERIQAAHDHAVNERDELRDRVSRLDRRATRAEKGLGEERAKVRQLQVELDQAIASAGQAIDAAMSLGLDDLDTTAMSAEVPADVVEVMKPGRDDGSDTLGAADAIAAAADLTASLADALRRAAAHLRPDAPDTSASDTDTFVPDGSAADKAAVQDQVRPSRPKRVPLRMARGVPDDSVDGVADLIEVPGIRVVVDGYNVAKTGWPDLDLALQRQRLLTGIAANLVATNVVVDVVFDGADVVARQSTNSRNVRVTWSQPGVVADDVIIEMVEGIATSTPVLVVSSDHEVQYRASRLGANIAGSPAFFLWLR